MGFLAGLCVGVAFGLLVAGWLRAGSDADDEALRLEGWLRGCRRYGLQPTCGHPLSAIETDSEGTSWCRQCNSEEG